MLWCCRDHTSFTVHSDVSCDITWTLDLYYAWQNMTWVSQRDGYTGLNSSFLIEDRTELQTVKFCGVTMTASNLALQDTTQYFTFEDLLKASQRNVKLWKLLSPSLPPLGSLHSHQNLMKQLQLFGWVDKSRMPQTWALPSYIQSLLGIH